MKVSFDVSCQIIVCLTHCIINMDTKVKKDEELFGKMKGSGDVKASTNGTIRQNAWQAIADILNA